MPKNLETLGHLKENYLIDGNFEYWDNGTSGGFGFLMYGPTMWHVFGYWARSTNAPDGSKYSLQIDQSGTPIAVDQFVPAYIGRQLAGQDITISWWAQNVSNVSFTRCLIHSFNVEDVPTSVTLGHTGTSFTSIDGTWRKFEQTFTLDANCANGFALSIRLEHTSSGALDGRIAQVKLELGTVATPFYQGPEERFRLYSHPTNMRGELQPDDLVATDTEAGFMVSDDKLKLNGIAENANNYVHPGTVQCNAITSLPSHNMPDHNDVTGITNSRTSTSASLLFNAQGMNNHRVSDDHHVLHLPDTRGEQRLPNYYDRRAIRVDFQNNSDTGAGGDGWHALMTVSPWTSFNTSHRQQQIAFTGTGGLQFRHANSDTAWAAWRKLLDSTDGVAGHSDVTGITNSRTSSSTTLLLNAAGMNNHRVSGDHDGRYYTKNQVDGMTITAVSPSNGLVAVHGLSGNFVKWDGWPGGNNRRYRLAKLVLSTNWNNIVIKGSVYGSSGASVGQTDFMFYVRTNDPPSVRSFSGWRRIVWEDGRRIHCHIVQDTSSNDVYLCATASDAALQSMKWEFKVMARNGQTGVSVSNFNTVGYFDNNNMPANHAVWTPDTISYAAG